MKPCRWMIVDEDGHPRLEDGLPVIFTDRDRAEQAVYHLNQCADDGPFVLSPLLRASAFNG